MLAELTLAVATLLQPDQIRPLLGCRAPSNLQARISVLRAADWRTWTRATLGKTWPEALDFTTRDPDTKEWIEYRRSGRVIEGRLECGENYLFEAPTARTVDHLREYSLYHAELTRPAALAVARLLIEAVGPPPKTDRAQTICMDCGDDEVLDNSQWNSDGQVHLLQVHLRQGVQSFIVALSWLRRPEN